MGFSLLLAGVSSFPATRAEESAPRSPRIPILGIFVVIVELLTSLVSLITMVEPVVKSWHTYKAGRIMIYIGLGCLALCFVFAYYAVQAAA